MLRLLLLSSVLLGTACDPNPQPDGGSGCGTGRGQVEVGRGGSRWRPLAPTGAGLEIVHGSQGGVHVLVGFAVRDMSLDMVATYRLVDPETGETVGAPTERALRPSLFSNEGGRTVRNPDLLILDNDDPLGVAFAGRTLDLELEAVSEDGHACDARRITLTGSP